MNCLKNTNKHFLFTLCVLIFFTSITNSNAAIPTVEGLFRNINNKDIDGTIAVISFKIEEQPSMATEETSSSEASELSKTKYIKIFLSVENQQRIEYLKIEYNGQGMSNSGVSNVSYYPNILARMKLDKTIERELFISMMNMFALNDSRGISQFLTRYNSDYIPNKSVLNEKKIVLYNKYKSYLKKVNENKDLKDELMSPFKHEDPEKNLEIKQVLKDSMYIKSNNVFLHKVGKKYFWKVNLDTTDALFENNSLKLKQVEFNNGGGTIDLRVGEYILFDGVHELPKIVYFKDLLERIFKVRILKYKLFSKLTKTIQDRYLEMKEELATASLKSKKDPESNTNENTASETEQGPEIFFY